MMNRRRLFGLGLGVIVLVLVMCTVARPLLPFEARWRVKVLALKLTGGLGEIPLVNLVGWLAPGSPVHLENLDENPNLHFSLRNRMERREDVERGKDLYVKTCHQCHGEGGRGESGPDLVSSVISKSDWAFFSTAKFGRAGTSMPAQPLSDADLWRVHAYVRDEALASEAAAAGASATRAQVDVPPEAILAADATPESWLTYAGNYAGHRHSGLTQLSKASVKSLTLAWVAQLAPIDRELQVSPIVAGTTMYVTQSREGVVALDVKTGATRWTYRRAVRAQVASCCGMPNRGVAVLGSTVFVATIDAYLVALDANTGKQKWITKVADVGEGYAMTGAPLALADRLIVGVSGGEYGARGFIAAFNAADGKRLWRFYTIPGPGEPGHDTWAGDSWKTGGGPTWTTGAYDPALDLVYWGVGNPSPEFIASVRRGDNLFSNSVVALNGKTGRLKWHYQFTPADEHDWDSNQQPVLANIAWRGVTRSVVLWANRNGFFYALDRKNGRFLFAEPFVKQTWNEGFDPNGRPRPIATASPTVSGTVVAPSLSSAANWWPPSYDPSRQLMFLNTAEAAGVFFKSESVTFTQGEPFEGGGSMQGNQPTQPYMKAVDVNSGKVRWQTALEHDSRSSWSMGGVLSTAEGVVFSGFRDMFHAFDADTGRLLWQMRLGGAVRGSPISYSVDGTQYVAVAAGHSVFVFTPAPTK